jgi:serine protease
LFGYGLIDAFRAVEAAQTLSTGGTTDDNSIAAPDPYRVALGTTESATLEIFLKNGPAVTVTNIAASETWLTVREDSVDANGLGNYLVEVDRSGLPESLYSGSLTFTLDIGNTIVVPVTMQVGGIDRVANISTMYVLLFDADFNLIDETVPVVQGNGVFSYEFVDVSPGRYIVLGGTDVDNDFVICQTSEACGSYPVSLSNDSFEVIDSDRTGLDFSAGIETSASTSQSQLGLNNKLPQGFKRTRPPTNDKPLPLKRTPEVLPQ